MFSKLRFFGAYSAETAGKAGDSLVALIVRFDPTTASAAQMDEFEHQLNVVTGQAAHARGEYNQEKGEYDAINLRYHQFVTAAENLQAQIADPANAARKAELEASLEMLVSQTEKIAPELDRAKKDVDDAESFLHDYEQAATEMAHKLATARQQLTEAQHNMEHAALERERASNHAEAAATLAGLRNHSDTFGVALTAMNHVAEGDHEKADALNLKAKLLTGEAHKDVENDPNIAAALKAASGVKPVGSVSDRLAALKAR